MAVTVRNPAELTLERYFELVRQYPGKKFTFNSRGEIVEMAPSWLHSRKQARVAVLLAAWLDAGALPGYDVGTEALHNLDGWYCQPDVAVQRTGADPGVPTEAPLLAVEVHSRSNTRSELEAKAARYLQRGTKMVWLLYPRAASLELHVAGSPPRTLHGGDLIEGGEVLPGFRVPVSDIFSDAS
ncbi:MAG: Uma2 family endonuclease [Anaerolineaceae bacterium]|nr:Uma2 family endonuclease [Anaerolineaceae bacterium]